MLQDSCLNATTEIVLRKMLKQKRLQSSVSHGRRAGGGVDQANIAHNGCTATNSRYEKRRPDRENTA
jgi:hypothetical protein